jgi:hypothetical protein
MPKKPTFKPNKKMGEGKPTQYELEYRQELLKRLEKEVYNPIQVFIHDKKITPEAKTSRIDEIVQRFIPRTNQYIENKITKIYQEGVNFASEQMKKTGAEHNPLVPDQPEQIQSIIRQQQNNIVKIAWLLRCQLVQSIDIKDNMGYYGKK